jgi:hypothetical protein
MNGKLHGYCVVCGVPWPCETASNFLRPNPLQAKLEDRVRMLGFVQDQLTERNRENEALKERERQLREANARLSKVVEGLCPECGANDLHSAELQGKAAISCCECDWISTYAALAQPTENSNGTL